MPKIFYSLPGEGLGHAIRTLAVLERMPDVEFHVFTWGEAYDFYKSRHPHLYQIAGLPFGRKTSGTIAPVKTGMNFLKFLTSYKESFRFVLNQYEEHQPALFVSDFEGIIPRVAKHVEKPCISIDNQHKFSRCKLDDLPWRLKLQAKAMGVFTEQLVKDPVTSVISTFYHKATRPVRKNTILTNCFVRKVFEEYQPSIGDYVLVYYKVSCGPKMLRALSKTNEKIKVYNCPLAQRIEGNFEYYDLANEEFVRDLAGCKALFGGAGNQLLGEAAYYGKPILTVPEPNQPEQEINGHYINKMGFGVSCKLEELTPRIVQKFLDSFECRQKAGINGVETAIEVIRKFLE